jgi:HSP20 family protein
LLTTPARTNGGTLPAREGRGGAWGPYRELLGFDPFRDIFPTMGSDYEVARTERGYDVEIAVPGYKPEQVEVTLRDDVLTVTGKNEKRSFTRSLLVPEEIDPDAIEAQVQNGLLTLTLVRRPETQPKRIEVVSKS